MLQEEISVKTTQPDASAIIDLQSQIEHQGVQIQPPSENFLPRYDVCTQGSQENVPSVHVQVQDMQHVHHRGQDHIIGMPAERDEYINENYSRSLETERVFQSNDGRQGVPSSTGCISTIFQRMRNLISQWSMYYCRQMRRCCRSLKSARSNIYGYLRRYNDVEVQNEESHELLNRETISGSFNDVSLDVIDHDGDFQHPGFHTPAPPSDDSSYDSSYHTPLPPSRASSYSVTTDEEYVTPPPSLLLETATF